MRQRLLAAFLGLVLAAVVLFVAVGHWGTAAAQRPPDRSRPDPNGQRACTTPYGLCRIADGTPPGQPCYCYLANGQRVGGFAREWNWEFPPFNTK